MEEGITGWVCVVACFVGPVLWLILTWRQSNEPPGRDAGPPAQV